MRTSFPGSRSGIVGRFLPFALALTVLFSTASNSYGGWFADLLASWFGDGGGGRSQQTLVNGGAPVPTIANDSQSANFILQHLVEAAEANGEEAANPNAKYSGYAVKLTTVMSQLSAEEQRIVFYGR